MEVTKESAIKFWGTEKEKMYSSPGMTLQAEHFHQQTADSTGVFCSCRSPIPLYVAEDLLDPVLSVSADLKAHRALLC